jgi:hypothetical protein
MAMEEIQGRQVASMLNEFGKKLNDLLGKGRDEARQMARTAQIGLEIMALAAQRVKLLEEMGEVFYQVSAKPGKARIRLQKALLAMVAQVRELDRKTASLKRALKNPPPEGIARRRGRPPKAASLITRKPGRRGRPPKAGKKTTRKPGRRGRPPKAGALKAARRPRKVRTAKPVPDAAPAA